MAHGNNVEGHGLQARFRSFLATILARSSRANQFQNDEVGVPSDPDLEYREARRREFRRARILDDQRRERQRAERILELTEKARAREGAERRADLRLADIREQYPSTQGRAAVAGGHPSDSRPIRKDARKPDSDRVKNIVPFDVESGREGAPLQDLESSDHYWTGVRGHGYFDGAYRSLDAWGRRHPGELVRIVGELKEEYDNEYDSTAVAVYLDGLKSGYVSASSSCTVFGYVAHLRSRGIRCLVPVEYEHDGADTDAEYSRSVYIALATVRRIPELVDAPLVEGELESFWDHLSAEDRDSFRKAGWHLDERTLTILNAHRPGLPHVPIPRICDGSEPHPVRIFLMRKRRECAEEREEETVRRNSEIVRLYENFGSIAEVARTLGLSTSTISRVLREAGVPRSTPKLKVTDDEIIHAYGRFSNMSRVGRELGVSSTTVSHVLDRHGVERSGRGIASTGMNGHNASAMLERNERCSQVLEMRESGASLDEISRALGISKGTAKILVRDGKFYRQPSSYPARISLAREMQNDPEGCASGMSNARVRKVKRDLAFLLQEHPDLILRY